MTTLAPPQTAGVLTGGPHNRGTIDLLEDLEATLGHDLWAEEEGREHVQHWDCQSCGAVLERRFADGLVTGAALTEECGE